MKLSEEFKERAKELGFVCIGVSPSVVPAIYVRALKKWVDLNHNASMKWIEREPQRRGDAGLLLEGAKSVVCLMHPIPIGDVNHPKKARFAQGEDYHKVLKQKLRVLVDEVLKPNYTNIKTKICVDTSPILEKAFAAQAGLGWIGKHTLLINPKLGSNFVLGEIITDVSFEPDKPTESRCGDCQACIDACPTKALIRPFVLNASKCISYLSIEHKGEVSTELQKFVTDETYGCDRCVDVCKYGRHFFL